MLDSLTGRAEFDLVAEFAAPLVSTVISELLGVPEGNRAEFHARSAVLASDASWEAVTEASDTLLTLMSELVYRKQIRPVIDDGATAMDRIFPTV